MKKKAIILSAVLIAALLFTVGCSNVSTLPYANDFTGSLPGGFLEANATVKEGTPFAGYTQSLDLSAEYSEISIDSYYNYQIDGYIAVGKTVGGSKKYGVYSLVTRSLALGLDYINNPTFNTITYYDYIKTNKKQVFATVYNGIERGIYNLTEKNWAIAMGRYSDVSVSINSVNGRNYEKRIAFDAQTGNSTTSLFEAYVDGSGNVVRTEITAQSSGETINTELYRTTYPNLPALDGYSYKIESSLGKITGYKNNKQIFEVYNSQGNNQDIVSNSFMANKYFYCQYAAALPLDAKDYSYVSTIIKYKLTTCRVDMTNGSIKYYNDFKYLISSANSSLDKNGKPVYISATATHINGDKLLDNSSYMLFNDDLGEVANLSRHNYSESFVQMSDNKYLMGNYIVDKECKVLLDLSSYSYVSYCANENVISLYNGSGYGVIDTNGKILVPFEYQNAFKFFNGYAQNYSNIDQKYYSIKTDGSRQERELGNFHYLNGNVSGLYVTYASNAGSDNYAIKNYADVSLIMWNTYSYYNNYVYTFSSENSSQDSGYIEGALVLIYKGSSYNPSYYILY